MSAKAIDHARADGSDPGDCSLAEALTMGSGTRTVKHPRRAASSYILDKALQALVLFDGVTHKSDHAFELGFAGFRSDSAPLVERMASGPV